MTRRGKMFAAIGGGFLLLLVAGFASADVRFMARGGYEEARILLKRRALDALIADPATSPERREQFQLVQDARRFAHDSLGLNAGQRFSTFSDVGKDTLVLVISASPKYRLSEYVWRFPFVGAVPYKGFFDFAAARAEARALESRGYDTYTRPAPAFSTLGVFNDPLLSTALTRDKVALASMVFHELTHSTIYLPSQTPFDESLANFVGWRAAECFFRSRGDTAGVRRAAAIWAEERHQGEVFGELSVRLSALYAAGSDRALMDASRDSLFAAARTALGWPARVTLNNASVIATRIYLQRLDAFDRIIEGNGGYVVSALRRIDAAVRTDAGRRDPYEAIGLLAPEPGNGSCKVDTSPLHSSP